MFLYGIDIGSKYRITGIGLQICDVILKNYPEGHKAAAVIPVLDLAQRQHGSVGYCIVFRQLMNDS